VAAGRERHSPQQVMLAWPNDGAGLSAGTVERGDALESPPGLAADACRAKYVTSVEALGRDAVHARVWARASKNKNLALASAALAIGYVTAHALLLERFPWFVDETYFAWLAQAVQGDPAQRFAALSDHKGLLISWIAAFLIHFNVPPMTAMRLISIVSGAVAVVATGYIVWRWKQSQWLAIATATLVAGIPYMFVHDSVGVYDAFIAAGSMVALVLELELARRQRLDLALVLGVTFGSLLLAKPTGELAIVLLPISLLMFDWNARRRWRRLAIWAGYSVLAVVIALAMYGLTRLSPLGYTPEPANHRTLGDLFSDPFGNWGTVAPWAWRALWGYLTPPGVVLAVWGLVRVILSRDRLGAIAAVWAIAALVAFFLLTDSAYPRYGLQAVPPLCILIAIGAFDLWARARTRLSSHWLVLLALVASIPMLLLDGRVLITPQTAPYPGLDRSQYVTAISNREPVREAAEVILRRAPKAFTKATPQAQRSVAEMGGWGWAAVLVLNGTHYTTTPRFIYMDQTSNQALVNHARFVIVEADAPPWLKLRGATMLKRWSRAGGPPVVLYDRGV
jgi:4-amino-4-deoxy-L-arabinose transferase-like glycosyltransferase